MPDVILNHDVVGETRDLALLLIHPLGGDLRIWDDFRRELGGGWTTIACDLRSAGQSPRPDEPVSLAQHARDLDALRRHVGAKAVIPIGCAIGAMIAAAYAAAHPADTPALVLTNPAVKTSPEAAAAMAERARQLRRAGMQGVLPAVVERAFMEQPRDARYVSYYERFAAQDAEAYALSCLAVVGQDITEPVRGIACPTLVVAGGHDVLLPPELSRAIHGLLPDGRYAIIEEGAHFLPYQAPRRLAELVRTFLNDNGFERP